MASLDDLDMQTMLRLEGDPTDQPLEEFIHFIREHYSLANVAYLCPSFSGYSVARPFVAATYSDSWMEHYRDEGYGPIDPVHNIGARSVLPVDWARLPRENRKVRRLFGEAKEAGVGHQGLTVPVRGPTNGVWALFSATSDDNDAAWGSRRFELTRDLVHIAHYIHQRAFMLHVEDAPADLNVVTRREIEALEWSAEGKTLGDIAILMRISAETVKAHLDSARFKLRAVNRVHAVTKAIRAGLIS